MPRLDPSNSPPHVWLPEDYYKTADAEPAPKLAAALMAACTCVPAPAIAIEHQRLSALGGSWLGDCGDASHTYGGHLPACRLPADDYTMIGPGNVPADWSHAVSGDFGMNWPAARRWLAWFITGVREDRITGIFEVIGSLDGVNARYWSDASGWHQGGVPYLGSGHVNWSHITVYRSTSFVDHRMLAGWSRDGQTGGDDMSEAAERAIFHARDIVDAMITGKQGPANVHTALQHEAVSRLKTVEAKVDKLATGGIDLKALAAEVVNQMEPRLRQIAYEEAQRAEDS